jgi:hypothetical protein
MNKYRYPIILALCLGSLSCADSTGPETAVETDSGADVDKLRSLPYVAFSATATAEGSGGLAYIDEAKSYPGYNIVIIQFECTAEMLDRKGRVMRTWNHEPCQIWESFELLPDGDFLVTGMNDVGKKNFAGAHLNNRYLLRLSWNNDVVWKSGIHAHHDVELAPDGNILTLTMAYRREELIHRGLDVRDNLLTRLDPDGAKLEERSLFDMFTAPGTNVELQKNGMKIEDGYREFDMFHVNSLETMRRANLEEKAPLYGLGNVLIASRNQDMIAVFDWQQARLVWSWGRGEVFGPHDATVLDNGNILIFDNGLGRGWSRSIELDPVAEKIVWEYSAPNPTDFYTASRGGNQRLPNGNTLITNSNSGQVFEVTRDGEIVWDYLTPHTDGKGHRSTIFRMKRFEPEFIDRIRRAHRDPNTENSAGL